MTFDEFYIHWYSKLKRFAWEYVISEEDAEDIVQDLFLELYETYSALSSSFRVNIVAYMFTAVKNRCIDYLRRKIIEQKSKDNIRESELLALRMKFDSLEILDNDLLKERDIEQILNEALQALPERCREILVKHKIEGMKQKDIAEELNISPKTVENQLTIAYRKLREELGQYPDLFSLLLVFFL
jgi:RNA polymerase sigma-70 factor (ECF subfamily)